MKFVAPSSNLDAFTCPFCNAYSHMSKITLNTASGYMTLYQARECQHCKEQSLWRYNEVPIPVPGGQYIAQMVFPDTLISPSAHEDMPTDVASDYNEAASILNKSPKAAAALLRLGLQKLLRHLGGDGVNINSDIRKLAADDVLPSRVIKVADILRITGNNAVHPGEMKDEDIDQIANKLFDLLNFIVHKSITEPKELDALYSMTPEGPRAAAEAVDARNKSS